MRILIGCERSGIVRDAFRARGHDATSCDLEPSEADGSHIIGDIFTAIALCKHWDLIILHPECTHMAVCGNGTWAGTDERVEAVSWTVKLWIAAVKACKRVCLENPNSVIHPVLRKHGANTQYVQPWWFGHPETKNTGLTKIGLPDLVKTNDVYEEMMRLPKKERHKVWYASPGKNRSIDRARAYPGMANALAEQWG